MAFSAPSAACNAGMASGVVITAKSKSRLYSAAPYNTQACPPINRARTSYCRIVARTRRIWVGIERVIPRRKAQRFGPTLLRREAHPCRHFLAVQIVEGDAWQWRFDGGGHWRTFAVWPSHRDAPYPHAHREVGRFDLSRRAATPHMEDRTGYLRRVSPGGGPRYILDA